MYQFEFIFFYEEVDRFVLLGFQIPENPVFKTHALLELFCVKSCDFYYERSSRRLVILITFST